MRHGVEHPPESVSRKSYLIPLNWQQVTEKDLHETMWGIADSLRLSLSSAADALLLTYTPHNAPSLIPHPPHALLPRCSAYPVLRPKKLPYDPLGLLPPLLCVLAGLVRLGIRLGTPPAEREEVDSPAVERSGVAGYK